MKRILILSAASGLAVGLLICLVGWWLWTSPSAVPDPGGAGGKSGPVLLRIHPGMTLTAAADSLVANELLDNRSVLLLGARLTGQGRALRAGLFALDRGLSPRALLEDLTTGLSVQIRVTIQEGLAAPQVAELVAEALGFPAQDFLAVADSLARAAVIHERLMADFGSQPGSERGEEERRAARLDSLLERVTDQKIRRVHWCEGYLAPDTYLFAEGTSPEFVARHLVEEQVRRLREAVGDRSSGGPDLNPHQLLTLASLVESEARKDEERALVAAVYTNRLARNWRLEADPTVAFILGKTGRRLYFKDLKVDSPYNTYRVAGLPPGPIASPGLHSLMAAARPDSTCSAMYFVSDGAGGHVFSRTIQEHEEAVRRFRKIRAAAGRR
jgi:peptidoglycan lytic transglycosylase G